MQIFTWQEIENALDNDMNHPFFKNGCGISIGSFDGLHKGHRVLLNTLVKKSKEMMLGYKNDYFLFMLSFTGWILFSILTLGIGLIYVIPYITVCQALYYEELKKITKNA